MRYFLFVLVLLSINIPIVWPAPLQQDDTTVPLTGYWHAEIVENRLGNHGCSIPGDIGYKTFARVFDNTNEKTIYLSLENPNRYSQVTQSESGVYISDTLPETISVDEQFVTVDRLTVNSSHEMVWEYGLAIRMPTGEICDPVVVYSLTFFDEDMPIIPEGPLEPGIWLFTITDKLEVTCQQSIFSSKQEGSFIAGHTINVSSNGDPIIQEFLMTKGDKEGEFTYDRLLTTLQVERSDYVTGTIKDFCEKIAFEGNLVSSPLNEDVESRDPVESIAPSEGLWTAEVSSRSIADLSPEVSCSLAYEVFEPGAEFSFLLDSNESGLTMLGNTLSYNGFHKQQNSGYYLWKDGATVSVITVISPQELLHEIESFNTHFGCILNLELVATLN